MEIKLTALFRDEDAAVLAAERVRELVGEQAGVRLLLPGQAAHTIEASVVWYHSPWVRTTIFGFALGLVGAYAFVSMGATWVMGLVSIFTGVIAGALLGLWLSGEGYPTRVATGTTARHDAALRAGQSIVTVTVARTLHEPVVRLLEAAGGVIWEEEERPPATGRLLPA